MFQPTRAPFLPVKPARPPTRSWCVDQFLGADPDLGGEETLDQDLAPGVRSVVLAAAVPGSALTATGLRENIWARPP